MRQDPEEFRFGKFVRENTLNQFNRETFGISEVRKHQAKLLVFRGSCERESDREGTAFADLAFDVDATAVSDGDVLDDR